MSNELSRRNMLGRAGLALGGLVTFGALPGCGEDDKTTLPPPGTLSCGPGTHVEGSQCVPDADTTAKALEFPYQKHVAATFQLDVAAVKEAAYHAYYNGGCCHGAYSALLDAFQKGVGAPFNQLPLGFGKFGGGGVAGFGSICGAVLGPALIVNMVVEDPAAPAPAIRNPMIVELMRWYETYTFPEYKPLVRDPKEYNASGALVTTLDFENDPAALRLAPGSHLCHASVTSWCTAKGVSASGADKLARCARLTADVAGKAATILNAYLASDRSTFRGSAVSGAAGCTGCHTSASVPTSAAVAPPVAAGMACTSCHADKATGHPVAP